MAAAAMSKSPRAPLQEVMTAVDAGHAAHVVVNNVDSASSDSTNNLLGSRRRSTTYGRGGGGARTVDAASTDASSFEFSTAVNSYSSASPASMVFSDGQLRAHQFPAVRSSAAAGSRRQLVTSPVRSSSVGNYSINTKQQPGVTAAGSASKRVSFATDGAGKAGAGQGKKSGGLLGCCGASKAVEPVARTHNRKVEAF